MSASKPHYFIYQYKYILNNHIVDWKNNAPHKTCEFQFFSGTLLRVKPRKQPLSSSEELI